MFNKKKNPNILNKLEVVTGSGENIKTIYTNVGPLDTADLFNKISIEMNLVKAKSVPESMGEDIVAFKFYLNKNNVAEEDPEFVLIEKSAYRVQESDLQAMVEISKDEADIVEGLPEIDYVELFDGRIFVDPKVARILQELPKEHPAMVVKGTNDPFFFDVAGLILESRVPNYYHTLATMIPVQSWMLTDAVTKTAKKVKKAEVSEEASE